MLFQTIRSATDRLLDSPYRNFLHKKSLASNSAAQCFCGSSKMTALSPTRPTALDDSQPASRYITAPAVPHRRKEPPVATIPDPVQTAYEAAAAQRTLSLPTIPEELRALEADDLRGGADEPLEAIDASGLIIADENFSELQAAHARFANCFLSCCDFSGSLFTDTVFEGCDFANSYFDNAGFTRCTFKNCKLTGASFMEANLEHVTLTDCTLDFGAFNRCRFWAVSATRCDFSGADMAEMELHYVTLDDDRFIGTSFFRTPLLGLDFSTCQLEGVALSDTMAEIYGTKMNVYQAAALARRLGAIVAE